MLLKMLLFCPRRCDIIDVSFSRYYRVMNADEAPVACNTFPADQAFSLNVHRALDIARNRPTNPVVRYGSCLTRDARFLRIFLWSARS